MVKTLALAVLMVALSACAPSPARTTTTTAAAPAVPRVRAAWSRQVTLASDLVAAGGGFAAYTLDAARQPHVLSVDAKTGAIRWQFPATPSYVLSGVGLRLAATAESVLYLAPAGTYARGAATVVALDAVTGRRRWAFGGSTGGLRVLVAPAWCGPANGWVCLVTTCPDLSHPRALVLDARDGGLLASRPAGDGRQLAPGLYADGRNLRQVSEAGRGWSAPIARLWDASGLDLDGGWDVHLAAGRYLGWIGARPDPAGVQHLGRGAVAAIVASSGRRLWVRRGVETVCGGLVFDAAHPVVCRRAGTIRWDTAGRPHPNAGPVRLEGIDPATGRTRWSWSSAGAFPGLVVADRSLSRVTDTRYLARGPSGPVLIDLDTGVRPATGALPDGWCRRTDPIYPAEPITAIGAAAYAAQQYQPCDGAGRPIALPATTPGFAGAHADGFYAWAAPDGIHAVTTR